MRALKINEETGNKNFESINLINIGSIYHLRSDYAKSLNYFLRAAKISKEIGSVWNSSRSRRLAVW
jgi:tetratricopeptide (TPR) repeat protein